MFSVYSDSTNPIAPASNKLMVPNEPIGFISSGLTWCSRGRNPHPTRAGPSGIVLQIAHFCVACVSMSRFVMRHRIARAVLSLNHARRGFGIVESTMRRRIARRRRGRGKTAFPPVRVGQPYAISHTRAWRPSPLSIPSVDPLDSVLHQLGRVLQSELFLDVRPVGFDRAD